MEDRKSLKKAVLRASKESGKILHEMFWEHYKVSYKDPKNLVTPADRASEEAILSILREEFPDFNVLAEEEKYIDRGSEYTWVVDPLDGTTNFTMKNPFFCSAIALAHKNDIVMAAVNAPFLKETYFAESGKGAEVNGEKISVSGKSLDKAIIAYCSLPDEDSVRKSAEALVRLRREAVDVRRMGAGELELCYVAAGRIEAYFMLGFHTAWDVAAGSLIVREASGMSTNLENRTWTLKDTNILASNGAVHNDVLRIIKEVAEGK